MSDQQASEKFKIKNILFFIFSDVLDEDNFLNCLNPGEKDEDELLHPKTAYILQQYSLEQSKFFTKLTEQQLGKPYKWAQSLCGLEFITCSPSISAVSNELMQASVPEIIRKIRNRLQSRLILYKQILELENKNVDGLNIPIDSVAMARVACNLVQWTSISWHEYTERTNITAKFVDEAMVTPDHLLYCAVIIRGSAKLECFISISPNFPQDVPLWAVSLSWNGTHNANNNYDIRVSSNGL